MPKRNDAQTIEDLREQNRRRQSRFYYKHLGKERKRKRKSQAEKRRLSAESDKIALR